MIRDFRSTHPANIGEDVRLWFGTEVEGNMSGFRTAFVASELTRAETAQLQDNVVGLRQLFLTETFRGTNDWRWLSSIALWLKFAHIPVTVGVMQTEVAPMLRFREEFAKRPGSLWLNIIVRIFDAPWANQLKEKDQISIGEPYHMVTFARENGVSTTPDEYRADVVDFQQGG